MTQKPNTKAPKYFKWAVSLKLNKGKFIDSVWVSALTEEVAVNKALEALKVFGIGKNNIDDYSIRKLDDVVECG